MGAEKPLMLEVSGLATRWKVLAGMSLWGAEEPVAMATWPGAVSDGLTVALAAAFTPLADRKPMPSAGSRAPAAVYWSTRYGVAPSSEITMTRGAAPAAGASSSSATSVSAVMRRSVRALGIWVPP